MWLEPKGYSVATDGWGVERKCDTYTCKHCQQVTEVPARANPNTFWCTSCMAPICKRCKAAEHNRPPDRPCSHFERRLELAERRQQLWEYIGWE